MRAASQVSWWTDLVVDGFFCIDLVLNFFTGQETYDPQTDILIPFSELTHGQVVRRYLRTWFVVDLVSCVPTGLVALALQGRNVDTSVGVSTPFSPPSP